MFPQLFSGGSNDMFIASIFIVYLCGLCIVVAIGITAYILKAIGLFKTGQRKGVSYSWLAFIPLASNFLFGKLAGEIDLGKQKIKNTAVWMLLFPLILIAITTLFFVLIAIIMVASGAFSHYGNANFPNMGFMTAYWIFFAITIVYGILMKIFYGMVYWSYFSQVKPNATSLLYALLGLFVPLALEINLFRTKDLPFIKDNGEQQLQS